MSKVPSPNPCRSSYHQPPPLSSHAFTLRDSGAFVAGDPLQPSATATTVKLRNGERLVTDGPYAETKEQLAGYYLIDVPTLDEALEWGARIPSARLGTIEVRPVRSM